ncbi:MAG TPA: cytidine deaminase, partial [Candidatus Synoicihabitans sp.]|nr:cytidine deaminase [Candidatus Synoicihabitans sp.]
CNCAERSAIFSAVTAGHREIRCVVIYTPTSRATAPCGACRQVIFELGPRARVVSVCDSADRIETTIAELLPRAFGPHDLDRDRA